jgi:translocation and assembly module TamB
VGGPGGGARRDEPRLREQRTGLVLDQTIHAPARIFVRGRGIDAEFGGSMTLIGPVADIQPIGSFQMRRGHITILGQRINFSFGTITLLGDLDPVLEFVATSRVRSVEITANVTGRASDPDIALASVPELPQDEIFAQFLFGRSLRDLSPLQIAQLASAAAGLAGGTDATGLLGQLRGAAGLDELDLVVGEEGGVAVQAGRYVVENVYLGVRAGQEGEAGVTVNLDITDDITARGEVGTDGRSKVGIFFEREY